MSETSDYAPLRAVLDEAYAQSAHGKGKDRHANNKPFDRQPILEVTRIVGAGFPIGQAMKKAGEACQMAQRGDRNHAIHECLGAIVYLAAAVVHLREGQVMTVSDAHLPDGYSYPSPGNGKMVQMPAGVPSSFATKR